MRVIDASGNPVTDLTQEDFTIVEDRVPQTIRLFEAQALRPEAPAPGALPARRELTEGSGRAIQNRRVFLFVFGRGRLQEPEKGIDAAIAFVRERLLPQDRAAVAAFNRATDFTTDRVAILRTLEEFRKRHKRIDAELTSYFSDIRGAYASQEPPPDIQAEIDAVFYADRLARVLPGVDVPDARRQEDERRRNTDALLQAGAPFDAYVDAARGGEQDLRRVYTAINYFRALDGEKHLVFVSERGMLLPRREEDEQLAALAGDARVAIHTIQTGGVITVGMDRGKGSAEMARVPPGQIISEQAMRNIAELTGGVWSLGSAPKAFAKVDLWSRAVYFIAYAPSNAAWDGSFRRIRVDVRRPNVRVFHRYGYYAPTR